MKPKCSIEILYFSKYRNFKGGNFSLTLSIFFTIRDRRHLSILGSQLFAHNSKARNSVKVYDHVRSDNSLGNPLIIDNSPGSTNRNMMLRSNVLVGELPVIYEIN